MKSLLRWTLDRTARWLVSHPVVMVVGVLLYAVIPLDLLPEAFLGPVGYIDDALVLLLPFILRAYIRRYPEPPARGHSIETSAE